MLYKYTREYGSALMSVNSKNFHSDMKKMII